MKKPKVTRRKITVGFGGIITKTDAKILDAKYSPNTLNFSFENGVLKSDWGISFAQGHYPGDGYLRYDIVKLAESYELKDIFYFKSRSWGINDWLMVVEQKKGNTIFSYYNMPESRVWYQFGYPVRLTLQGDACAVNYNLNGQDMLLASSEETPLFTMYHDGNTTMYNNKVADTPCFVDLAVHNERVFGVLGSDRNQVWFSDEFDPLNWRVDSESAGYIQFADDGGRVLKLISFQNYLYIFRERSIYRLTAYTVQSEFVLKKVADAEVIYKETISMEGDRIVFLTSNGLFSFDGYNVTPIAKELPELFYKEYACGSMFNGCYYLACRTDLASELSPDFYFNNALIKYNFSTGQMSVLAPVDIHKMLVVKIGNISDLLFIFNVTNRNCIGTLQNKSEILDNVTKKIFKSAENLIDKEHLKTVRKISFTSKYPVMLIVCLDNKEYPFEIEGGEGIQNIVVDKSGYAFSVRLETTSYKSYITPLSITVDVLQE